MLVYTYIIHDDITVIHTVDDVEHVTYNDNFSDNLANIISDEHRNYNTDNFSNCDADHICDNECNALTDDLTGLAVRQLVAIRKCLARSDVKDRLILDRRPANSGERRLHWATLPYGPMLCQFVLHDDQELRASGDDL